MALNTLPIEIMNWNIFPYLSPMDIFNLGQCSKDMRAMVTGIARHPLSTKLQAIKTVQNVVYNTETVYEMVNGGSLFSGWRKCSTSTNCGCGLYRQRGEFTILDPVNCEHCVHDFEDISYQLYCGTCSLLLQKMFALELCAKCYETKIYYCTECNEDIEK